ncbi:hypothetical protein Ae201684P_017478 [Aphanomyces euteiches]|uniref:RING-type domain-containing protein n=1 Tax=Aphanomyces euteiches TaxID=100861 RepID=A0A6G0XLX4_9STRA|nr:hypothetical protein Ae201684_003507 [Aphanomyces euteiches]KAH9098262.1 hypothetical protein Ae201684P_017478 [Aphanomyces euteiches]
MSVKTTFDPPEAPKPSVEIRHFRRANKSVVLGGVTSANLIATPASTPMNLTSHPSSAPACTPPLKSTDAPRLPRHAKPSEPQSVLPIEQIDTRRPDLDEAQPWLERPVMLCADDISTVELAFQPIRYSPMLWEQASPNDRPVEVSDLRGTKALRVGTSDIAAVYTAGFLLACFAIGFVVTFVQCRSYTSHLQEIECEVVLDVGIPVARLMQLKVIKYGARRVRTAHGQDSCPICLGDYASNDDIRELPCGHGFHVGCIDSWLRLNKLCPLCKADVEARLALYVHPTSS